MPRIHEKFVFLFVTELNGLQPSFKSRHLDLNLATGVHHHANLGALN